MTAPPFGGARPVRAIDDPANGLGEVVTFSVAVSDDHDPAPSGSLFPLGTTMVTCTATDASGNESTTRFPVTVHVRSRVKRL